MLGPGDSFGEVGVLGDGLMGGEGFGGDGDVLGDGVGGFIGAGDVGGFGEAGDFGGEEGDTTGVGFDWVVVGDWGPG